MKKIKLEKRLEKIIEMWDDHTLEEIGKELGVTKQAVSQLANKLRQKGVTLVPKRENFDWDKFVKSHKKVGKK